MIRWFTILLLMPVFAIAQDSSKSSPLIFNGYLKEMGQFVLPNDPIPFQYTNLLHNRLNFKYKPQGPFSAGVEIRNRYFLGDAVKNDPNFTKNLMNPQDLVNMNVVWYQSNAAVLHSNVERLWVGYQLKKFNVRVGRQRINWGMANSWNPNDIFNSYNLLDFDYEERPGADAVKMQYLISDLSNIEAAIANGPYKTATMAAKYTLNRDEYDWQFLAGTYAKRFTAGLGWSGNLGKAGFKGETQMFYKKDSLVVNVTAEVDYITEKGWYLNAGFLFNQQGIYTEIDDWSSFNFKNTPDNLMPTRWNFLAGSTKAFTPLFTGSLMLIYAPGTNMLILFPSLTYSLMTNLDLNIFWQSFFADTGHGFNGIVHTGYLRLKWSF
ncbi:MAG TPA: hypothetical protein VK166_17715 [Chitinophagaceae bacterium]|nr:hypothetical protein [Chitinophagaceae bacterium]